MPMLPYIFGLPLCVGGASLDVSNIWDDVFLNRWNAIVSHDAATGYVPGSGIVNKFVKTQTVSWPQQLDCGARVFDVRIGPITDEGLIFHHGKFKIHYLFEKALEETIAWASAHPGELVVLYLAERAEWKSSARHNSTKSTDPNLAEFKRIVAKHNVPMLLNCTELSTLTVRDARLQYGRLSHGVIVVDYTCTQENYDPSVHCSSIIPSFCCYRKHSEKPFTKLWSSLENGTQEYPTSLGFVQAHWQYSATSIVASEWWHGSVVIDEQASELNKKLAQRVTSYKALSWIEINNVCDAGNEIFDALNNRRRAEVLTTTSTIPTALRNGREREASS